jgi:hypothetical protein
MSQVVYGGGTYELDAEQIKLNAYRLGCLFFANKEIARRSDPASPSAAARLEQHFFVREMSHLLLQIAIALRVMDDQMRARPKNDAKRAEYFRRRDETDTQFQCMMFDDLPLREVCNKIIHALTVEPHLTEAVGDHHLDDLANEYACPEDAEDGGTIQWDPVKWNHLTGNIRLVGRKGSEEWYLLLEVPVFIEAISSLLRS